MMMSERIHVNNIRQILNYVRANECLCEFTGFILTMMPMSHTARYGLAII